MLNKRLLTSLIVACFLSSGAFAANLPKMKKIEKFINDSDREIGCYHYFAMTGNKKKQEKYQGILRLSGLIHKMDGSETDFGIGYGVGRIEFSLQDKPALRKAVYKKLAKSCD